MELSIAQGMTPLGRGMTPLHRAAQLGLTSVSEILLEAGACVNAVTESGETPLHLAALYAGVYAEGHEAVAGVLRLLLKSGADVRAVTSSGETPLHLAARVGDSLTTAVLIAAGSDVRAADRRGEGSLHKVCRRVVAPEASRVRTARLLLAAKADPNVRNSEGLSPLHILLLSPENTTSLDLLRELLARGADPNLRTGGGQQHGHPLLLALEAKRTGMARVLVEHGADVNVVAGRGRSPLHLACQHGDAKLVGLILSRGGDPRKPDCDGLTPLRFAVEGHSETTLRACVRSGASTWQRTASLSASSADEAVNFLRQHPLTGEVTPVISAVRSPFFYALYTANTPALRSLLASGSVSQKELYMSAVLCDLADVSELSREQENAVAIVREASQSPPSLQMLTRWEISHQIGCHPGRASRVRSLGLPAMLRNFVLFADA